jgi:diguanylate cyclase (GGDEF)-like protein
MHRVLASYAAQTPQVDAFVFIGAEGRVLSTSRQYPTAEINAEDRDYFVQLRDNLVDRIFISRPIMTRGGGSLAIFLARRVSGADGRFLGVVLGSMHLRYFDSFYKDIGLPSALSITLLRRDGVVLTRYPLLAGQLDTTMPAESPWYRRVGEGGGSYLSPGFLGSGPRFVSVHPVRDYPVVVDVSVSYEAALVSWWRQTGMLAVGAAAAFLAAVLLGRALMVQMRAIERAHDVEMARACELETLKQKLERESLLLATTLEQMDQGLMMVGADGRVEICNHRAEGMLDLPAEMMARRPLFQEVLDFQMTQDEFSATDTRLRGQIHAGGLMSMPQTYERQRPCGIVLEVRSVPLAGGGVVRTFTDITERKRSEERVRFLAHHDGLTRLLNRSRIGDRLDEAVAGRGAFALLYLDLDHFKEVNDTYGHPVGDRLLQTVSSRLLATVRDGDAVARMGGDEFCIIAHDVGSAEVAGILAQRLLRNVIAPYDIDAVRVRIGLSIGIALFPQHGESAEALMRQADVALYRVKQSGRNTWRVAEGEGVSVT